MRRRLKPIAVRVLLLAAAAWTPAGVGYAQLGLQPLASLPRETPAKKPAATGTPAENGGAHEPKLHLKLNPDQVLALQMQALNAQYEENGQTRRGQNRFTKWMDGVHDRTYCWMDDAVRRIDVKWLAEDAPYDPELSTFKLKLLTRTGGKSSEKNFDFKVRFRADMALPGLERSLHLSVDNAGQDELPGTDPMKKESDMRLGVRTMFRTLRGTDLSMGGGLRWRDGNPVVYLSTDWRLERPVEDGILCLNPQATYHSDEGFGQKIVLAWTRPVGPKQIFQTRTAERTSEALDSVEFEQSLRFAWLRSGRGRGWVAQISVFPHIRSSDWYWDDSLVNLTWRDALYRKWIYYTVTPQVQFPKEDEYQARPSLRIGLEILFGGKVGELL